MEGYTAQVRGKRGVKLGEWENCEVDLSVDGCLGFEQSKMSTWYLGQS